MSCIDQINNPAAINRISGQPIRMPGNNPLGLALFNSGNHFIKEEAAGNLGGHGLNEFFLDG
ncbi:MAG: hypothetical protein Q7S00_05210 [bacterium]|nr:hypothetical protein [bacterium]